MGLLTSTSEALVLQYKGYLKNCNNNCKEALSNYQHNFEDDLYASDQSDGIYYAFESVINDIQYDIDQIYANPNNYKRSV